MRLIFGLMALSILAQRPIWAQEDYDIPPPPPIMDDEFDEPMVEPMDIPPPMDSDMVDDGAPVYDIPPEEDEDAYSPAQNGPPPNNVNGSRFGFSRPAIRPNNSSPKGGGNTAFGETEGKVKFQLLEGVFWEKGQKRSRGERHSNQD